MTTKNEKPLAHVETTGGSTDSRTASTVAPTSTVSHSPLPWKVCTANDTGDARTHGLECADGWTIADLYDDAFWHYESDSGRALANAEFIVEACNAYPSLVAERDALLSALKAIVAMYGPSTDYSHDAAAAWRQAEAALASVEGK